MSGNRAREQHRTSTSAADVIMASSPAVTASTAVGVLDKAVTLVQVLAGSGPLSIAELAEHSGVARPTVHRLVGSLVAHQVLERTGETVTLGIRLVEWAHSAGAGRTLAAVADAVMREVSAETGESVQLYVRRGERAGLCAGTRTAGRIARFGARRGRTPAARRIWRNGAHGLRSTCAISHRR